MNAPPGAGRRSATRYKKGDPIPLPPAEKGFFSLMKGEAWDNMPPQTMLYNSQTIFRRLGLAAGVVFLKVLIDTVRNGIPEWREVTMADLQEFLGEQERSIRNSLAFLVRVKLIERTPGQPWRMRVHPELLEEVPVREPRRHECKPRTAGVSAPIALAALRVRPDSTPPHFNSSALDFRQPRGAAAWAAPPPDESAGGKLTSADDATNRRPCVGASAPGCSESQHLISIEPSARGKQMPWPRKPIVAPTASSLRAESGCPFNWACPHIISSLGGNKDIEKSAEAFIDALLSPSSSAHTEKGQNTLRNQNPATASDSGPSSGGPKYASDIDELIALVNDSTSILPDRRLIWDIRGAIELRGGTLREYLDDIRPRIGRLRKRPGPGFFLDHARKWGGPASSPAPEPTTVDEATLTKGRCTRCPGTGRTEDGYCSCPMGRDLQKVEQRLAQPHDAEAKHTG